MRAGHPPTGEIRSSETRAHSLAVARLRHRATSRSSEFREGVVVVDAFAVDNADAIPANPIVVREFVGNVARDVFDK
jgi:hypothetical protein